mmetsp:Transcript_17372/g.25499  ORF Transcript_17372/g.25499 Transcript_17372/m.25499 type:complete len:294 (+) Transcript_17372:45-926(+)
MIIASPNINTIKRVVTCFILCREDVAIFHRCDTMPTFPSHWGGISGSIDKGETPIQAVQRELLEETNLPQNSIRVEEPGGLYLDIKSSSSALFGGRTIRVYPFRIHITPEDRAGFELRGNEHDAYKFVSVREFRKEDGFGPTVPGLVDAFHHSTFGKYLDTLPKDVRDWEENRVDGAASLARSAMDLAGRYPEHSQSISMLRPSMVPIVNVLNKFEQGGKRPQDIDRLVDSLREESERCVSMGVDVIRKAKRRDPRRLAIATFSRSSTMRSILSQIQADDESVEVICGRSTPG